MSFNNTYTTFFQQYVVISLTYYTLYTLPTSSELPTVHLNPLVTLLGVSLTLITYFIGAFYILLHFSLFLPCLVSSDVSTFYHQDR